MSRKEVLILAALALLGLGALAMALFGADALPAVKKLKAEEAGLQGEVEALEKKREDLQRKTKRMQDDPRMIERKARQDLGMVREGETVIIIPDKDPNGRR